MRLWENRDRDIPGVPSHCECRCDALLRFGPSPELIRNLRELHEQITAADGRKVCAHCIDSTLEFMSYPCPTMRHVIRYEKANGIAEQSGT